MRGVLFILLFFLAPIVAEAATLDEKICPTKASTVINNMTVNRCYDKSSTANEIGDFTFFYGSVEMDLTGNTSFAGNKGIGKALRSFFKIKGDFTTIVSAELYKSTYGEDVLVYQKPLFSIKVTDRDKTQLEATLTDGADIQISPIFALERNKNQLKLRVKYSLVRDQSGGVTQTIKEGVDIASKFGGHGWLVTAVTEPTFVAFAGKAEAAIYSLFQEQADVNLDTFLRFDNGFGYKAAHFDFAIPTKSNGTSTVGLIVRLKPSQSFIGKTRSAPDAAGQTWPQAPMGGGRWADAIVLRDATAGVPAQRLGNYIDAAGVLQKLLPIQPAVVGGGAPLAAIDQIRAACAALENALTGDQYRLSDADVDFVLYDELKRAGVFDRYATDDLPCVNTRQVLWARYGLIKPKIITITAPKEVVLAERNARMEKVATSWSFAEEADRARELGEDFTATVQLHAPQGFLSSFVPLNGEGLQVFPTSPGGLATKKKVCFGNFKPPADIKGASTAFAKFDGDDVVYLVRAWFDTSATWEASSGPRIKELKVTVATVEDKVKTGFDLNGKCLS